MRRRMAGTLGGALLVLVATVGCGSSSPGAPSIASTALAGKVDGQSWSLGTAATDTFFSTSTYYYLVMYSDMFTACTGSSSQQDYVFATVPLTAGDYPLNSQGFTANFALGGSTPAATSGHLVISSVTSTTITGGINVTANGDNTIDGQFTATICQ